LPAKETHRNEDVFFGSGFRIYVLGRKVRKKEPQAEGTLRVFRGLTMMLWS
jgi:hypothetical protein